MVATQGASDALSKENAVFVAMRGGTVGYFEREEDVPAGWKLCPDRYDISSVMASLRVSKARTLDVMNDHWRSAPGIQRR